MPPKIQVGPCCLLSLMLLLGALTFGDKLGVSAQGIGDDVTRTCGMASVKLNIVDVWELDREYQQFLVSLAASRRECPYRSVCAQKLTAVDGQDSIYSEGCWDPRDIIEYTEVACFENLCNDNVTLGRNPILKRKYFYPDTALDCYNHGQIPGTSSRIISSIEYQIKNRNPLPVSRWSNGMCGAAVYASNYRTQFIHERVITGDRAQKFALLQICPSAGCDRSIVRSFMQRR